MDAGADQDSASDLSPGVIATAVGDAGSGATVMRPMPRVPENPTESSWS